MERKTITVNESINTIVSTAAQLWPELSHNYSALVGKIIANWDQIRSDGGGKTDRLCTRMDGLEAAVANLSKQVEMLRTGEALIVNARDNGCDSVVGFDDQGMEIDVV